jgi:anti-sigma regulatory factor (Ser/Thr protein kinase)
MEPQDNPEQDTTGQDNTEQETPDNVIVEECRPPLRTSTPKELLKTHAKFGKLVKQAVAQPGQTGNAHFDLHQCEDVDPGAVLLLIHAAQNLADYGWQPILSGPTNFGAAKTIRRHIEYLWMPREERNSISIDIGDYPLRAVRSRNEMVQELELWAQCVAQATGATEATTAFWQTCVGEIATNTIQHGMPPAETEMVSNGLLLAGAADPVSGNVQLAVLDRGRGIPNVLRPKLPKKYQRLSDGYIIRESCRKGVTSRCVKSNQGFGLFKLVESMIATRGDLQILSNNGIAFTSKGEPLQYGNFKPVNINTPVFSGTLTVLNTRKS